MIAGRSASSKVGSGFSTIIAKRAIDYAGLDTRVVVIDSSPRTDVRSVADELTLSRVDQAGLIAFDGSTSDVLFIDSSHISLAIKVAALEQFVQIREPGHRTAFSS